MADVDPHALDPFEPDGGQDDEPPDLRLALVVAIKLLRALHTYLDPDEPHGDRDDLRLRIAAVRHVLVRVHAHLEDS